MHMGDGDDEEDNLDVNNPSDMAAFAVQLRSGGMTAEANEAAELGMEAAEEHEATGVAPYQALDWCEDRAGEWAEDLFTALSREQILNALEHLGDTEQGEASLRSAQGKLFADLIIYAHEQMGEIRAPSSLTSSRTAPGVISPTSRMEIQAEIDEMFLLPDAERLSQRNQNKLSRLFEKLVGDHSIVGVGQRSA